MRGISTLIKLEGIDALKDFVSLSTKWRHSKPSCRKCLGWPLSSKPPFLVFETMSIPKEE
jgi:hypothetical protein